MGTTTILPARLQPGDTIRVIAPARSLSLDFITQETISAAEQRLRSLGYQVTYGAHVRELDMFQSSSVESRLGDLHDAFVDPRVKAIFTVIGGYNSNQLLQSIDYDVIRKNPKILCGFSDITALSNAIYARTALITYSGPHFVNFAMRYNSEYMLNHFQRAICTSSSFEVRPSPEWSDDSGWFDIDNRELLENEGYWAMNEGAAEGTIVGGNLSTLSLLQGTEFMPRLDGSILFIEEDAYAEGCDDVTFDRMLQSLLHQPGFAGVKGMIVGRFQKAVQMTREKLSYILDAKRDLQSIPILANADFGHTSPIFTFPIGGRAKMIVEQRNISLVIAQQATNPA